MRAPKLSQFLEWKYEKEGELLIDKEISLKESIKRRTGVIREYIES